jgi:hypothetical protein
MVANPRAPERESQDKTEGEGRRGTHPPDHDTAPQGIEFRCVARYLHWAALVDSEAPGLRRQLCVTPARRGAVVWLHLHDARRLTEDGCDVLLDAARRVRRSWRVR